MAFSFSIIKWSFDCKKITSLQPGMLCANNSLSWPKGSGEDFENFSKYFRYFVTIFHWKRAGPFIEQNWIPFIKGCFVSSLVERCCMVLEKNNFNYRHCIFAVSFLRPLRKGRVRHIVWIPFTQGCYVPSLVEIGPVVLEKIFKFRQCIFVIYSQRKRQANIGQYI